jgi:hypothetical protein
VMVVVVAAFSVVIGGDGTVSISWSSKYAIFLCSLKSKNELLLSSTK